MLIYWPNGVFNEIQITKEIGAIAASALRQHVNITIICGGAKASMDNIVFHETGITKRTKLSEIMDTMIALTYLLRESPDYILLYYIENYGNILLITMMKTFLKVFRLFYKNIKIPKIMIKSDTDGEFIEANNIFIRIAYRILLVFYLRFTDGVIVETTCVLEKIAQFLKRRSGFVYLPDGYSSQLFNHENNVIRKSCIITIARFLPFKNIEASVRIFKRISSSHHETIFKIIGPITDIDYYEYIKTIIIQANMQDKIEILSPSSQELANIVKESLIMISTSLMESFGIARMEVLGSGTPVVTYESGCGKDFEKFGAIVVPLGDEDSMYNEVIRLLENHSYWEKKSLEGIKNSISWDEVVSRLMKLFE